GLVLVVVFALLTGQNPLDLLGQIAAQQQDGATTTTSEQPYQESAKAHEQRQFVAVVLGDTEDVWHGVFRDQLGREYQEPRLGLFSGAIDSGCGFAQAAVGPFYCPQDHKVYIDLAFYDELQRRFGAPGDFAQAYVNAHEVGHHVQNLHGLLGRGEVSSVPIELQADCLAGAWARSADTRAL